MSSVYHDSPTNSTFFTTCCQVAINDDEQKCPHCKQDVYPFFKGMTDKDRAEAASGYYHDRTKRARWNRAFRRQA